MFDAMFDDQYPDVPAVRGDAQTRRGGLPTPQVFEQALMNVMTLARTCSGGWHEDGVVSRGVDKLMGFYRGAWGGEET